MAAIAIEAQPRDRLADRGWLRLPSAIIIEELSTAAGRRPGRGPKHLQAGRPCFRRTSHRPMLKVASANLRFTVNPVSQPAGAEGRA